MTYSVPDCVPKIDALFCVRSKEVAPPSQISKFSTATTTGTGTNSTRIESEEAQVSLKVVSAEYVPGSVIVRVESISPGISAPLRYHTCGAEGTLVSSMTVVPEH